MTEHDDQAAIFEWARLSTGRYPMLAVMLSIPNGAKLPYRKNNYGVRYSPEANKLMAEGLLPGASDIFLPYPVDPYHGLFIEMKTRQRIKNVSEEQRVFIWAVRKYGYAAVVSYGVERTIKLIEEYINGHYTQSNETIYYQPNQAGSQ